MISYNNPDILTCLANLSSDEVFTPPKIVNDMLDLLPQNLFTSPDTKFLDPASKSGVFLREIARRLIDGLAHFLPNTQERVNHIMQNQIFSIAITELTSFISRRSLYCSMNPDSNFSVCKFNDSQGNVRFKNFYHTFHKGKCIFCGADESKYKRDDDLESHAYEFIHTIKPEEIFNMQFDVIISNPPYQLNVGVEKQNYAVPIYQKFVENAKKLNSRYISMIIPARWYAGGRGLEEFREEMLNDRHIIELHDFPNSVDCFNGVDLAGGVCYFLWDRDNEGDCKIFTHISGEIVSIMTRPLLEENASSFIRHNQAISILRKIQAFNEKNFSELVSPQTPFGIITSFKNFTDKPFEGSIKYYTYEHVGYIKPDAVNRNQELISKHKVFISAAYGERGEYPFFFLGRPFYGEPNSCCSQTYLVIGPFENKQICQNVILYIATKFFRFLVLLLKNTQNATRAVYQLVPFQDFKRSWTDSDLYAKYNLDSQEIAFIESMIKPMQV